MHTRCSFMIPVALFFPLVNVLCLREQLQVITRLNHQLNPMYTYLGHDFPENLPLPVEVLPNVPVFAEESVHYPLLGNLSDPEWFSLVSESEGFGYIRLGENHRLFMVTMFHDMHCLRILNLAFSKAPIATPEHIQHCLNHLRQGALCSPDLSLEPGNFEEKDFDVERTGAIHTCKDWEVVYETMSRGLARWLGENEVGLPT